MAVIMRIVNSDVPCEAVGPGRASFRQWLPFGYFKNRIDAGFNPTRKVSGPKARGNHFPDNATGDGIRHHSFETVPDLDAKFSIVASDEEDGTVIEAFLADFPGLGDANAKVFETVTFQAGDG